MYIIIILIYLIIFSKSLNEHIERVNEALARLREAGLKVIGDSILIKLW